MSETEFFKCECRHCAGHIEFPTDAAGQTVPCPHCGKLTELPPLGTNKSKLRLVVFCSAGVLVAAGLLLVGLRRMPSTKPGGLSNVETNSPVARKLTDEIMTNEFSVSGVKLTKTTNSSLIYVTGKVRNLSNQKRFGVKVEFSLLTAKVAPDGNASDYASSLDPNSEWNFKALVLDSKAATARFRSIAETK
ncbi:MAG TPA: FxLYD domain-containing protein [Candidatus Sulfotelmatobacter sp.]|jgi:hypothetical protein|nr:FxLYD domain-containing protein [Candidatus Sulfotelmatobacter sp.]